MDMDRACEKIRFKGMELGLMLGLGARLESELDFGFNSYTISDSGKGQD